MRSLLTFVLTIAIIAGVRSQSDSSPCPSVFYYESDGFEVYGVIEAPDPPPYGSVMRIRVGLSLSARVPGDYVGQVELYRDKETTVREIRQGFNVKYRVKFPLQSPLPVVVRIVFDERVICSGPPAVGRFVTSIDLSHTFRSGQAVGDVRFDATTMRPPPPTTTTRTTTTTRPTTTTTRTTTRPTTLPPRIAEPEMADLECGTIPITIMPLIFGGDEIQRGEGFPWLVAIYRRTGGSLNFICGGTLVSKTLVVTAAHCVTKEDRTAISPSDLILRLGVYDIDDWTDPSAVTTTVSKIIIKDYYKDYVFQNDIAGLVLAREATLTPDIVPICLWSGSTDQDLVVGQNGTVAGWGRNSETNAISTRPNVIEVPLVSTTTCRGSNQAFFGLTSETTLCAGSRQGTGPCSGDSGGGLYLRVGERWFLRGIVSNALRDERNSCDLYQYVIYTDSAKYLAWIATMR